MKLGIACGLIVWTASLAGAQVADPAADGVHLLRRETIAGLTRPDGEGSTMQVVLPAGAGAARPTVLFVHGWFAEPDYYTGLAENLASRGFAVALFDNVDRFELDLEQWIVGARRALDALEQAAADPASPLFGELDLARLAVMGHSYGGSTTIALAALDARVKVAVALTPGAERRNHERLMALAAQDRVPTLVVGAELDPVVTPWVWALPAFRRLPAATPRLYVEIAGGEHVNVCDVDVWFWVWRPLSMRFQRTASPEQQRELSRRYATAWLEHHLGITPDQGGWTDGSAAAADFQAELLSRYAR